MPAPIDASAYVLVRADDRLLHGQVIYGWGAVFEPRGYLILDDAAAGDPWERDAFVAAAPPEVEVEVRSVSSFATALRAHDHPAAADERAREHDWVMLLRDIGSLVRLVGAGFRPAAGFNLGGLHAGPDTTEYLPYLHLTPPDRQSVLGLLDEGVRLFAQDLPQSRPIGGQTLKDRLRS